MQTRAKINRPKFPKELGFESMQAYKAAMREYDARRIATGEATAEQIQRENSWVRSASFKKILNFPEAKTD